MTDLHAYCLDVTPSEGGALHLRVRLVETEGLPVDALLLRYEIALDPFAVCIAPAEEEAMLERLAALEPAADGAEAYRLCGGAVVVHDLRATGVADLALTCVGAGVAEVMDVVSAADIPLRVRLTGDAFVSDAAGPHLETEVLDQERTFHVPLADWRAARVLGSAEAVIDLVEAEEDGEARSTDLRGAAVG